MKNGITTMKNTYYLIDTLNWRCIETSVVLAESDVAAKNAGYMLSNSTLRWYRGDALTHLPIKWTPKED